MTVIEIQDVWKKYKQYHDKGSTLKEKLLFRNRNRYEERWVLKGISLKIDKGQTWGLLGENGSGKSTLLKLLTRISYPNRGEIAIRGKVSSLLELVAGFHPDMSGRENIYINASIFGLSREEIDRKLDGIIAFSELAEFMDNPVRTYSSGMYMRLAFSVAIHVDADILLVDEILAVGDMNFQKKCFQRMQQLKNEGVTIVLVSHDLSAIEKLCDRALWIHEGRAAEEGQAQPVCKKYLQFMLTKDERHHRLESAHRSEAPEHQAQDAKAADDKESGADTPKKDRWGSGQVRITQIYLEDREGTARHQFSTEEPITICLRYERRMETPTIGFGIAIKRADGVYCYGTNTFIDGHTIEAEKIPDHGEVCCYIEALGLLPGSYTLDTAAHDKDGLAYDYRIGVLEFGIHSEIRDEGVYRIPHRWTLREA